MDVTHHLDHLQVLNHVANMVQGYQATSKVAKNLPKSAKTTHYGPDGTLIASQSTTSYTDLKVSNGKIAGGRLQHTSSDETGKAISLSEVAFQQDGTPGTVNTAINNRFSDGLYKKITIDMSSVLWNAASNVVSGSINISSTHAEKDSLRTVGSFLYKNEDPVSGQFTHYVPQGDGSISGFTNIDYTKANFRGSRITGGYCAIDSQDATGATKANSNMFMSNKGLIQEIHTTNFDPKSGETTGKVVSDFSNLEFTPRNEFKSGTVTYNTTDDKGNPTLKTTVSYSDSVPTQTESHKIKNRKITHKIVTDYSNATFNNDLAPINCIVITTVTNAAGKLCSKTETKYDSQGNPKTKITKVYSSQTEELFSTVTSNYANVVFNHSHKPIGGTLEINLVLADGSKTIHSEKDFGSFPSSGNAPLELVTPSTCEPEKDTTKITTVKNAKGQITEVQKIITRSNGTLLKKVITHLQDDKPASSNITLYGIDGMKVLKTYSLNLANISYDSISGQVSGAISLQSKFAGAVLDAESTLMYS
ncbi:MAG: hypothetical protein AAGF54_08085 [Pseudomonadota bacterium]